MRQKVDWLRQQLQAFVEQRDDVALVVRCSEADCALVTKVLEGLDESSTSELYWVVIEAFRDVPSFVEACVQAFATRHEAVRLTLQQRKLPAWPPLPVRVQDPAALPPVARLKELMTFSRSLLPTLNGCAVVWALLPMHIGDAKAYAGFMRSLWQHEFPFPWCHHVRLLVRDDFPAGALGNAPAESARVGVCEVDFSPDAIRQGLEEEMADDRAELSDRVNSCLMLAGIDFSHGRYDRAVQQYEVVHRYAAATQNPTLATVALNGLGDALRSQGRLDEAVLALEAALAPASMASHPPIPVLFDLYMKLGEMRVSQRRWEEAEVFLQGATDFAYLLHDPDGRLRGLRLLGDAQYEQAKTDAALQTWFAGAVVAGKLGKDDQRADFTASLRRHYEARGAGRDFVTVVEKLKQEIATLGPDAGPRPGE
jgi:tetratricopeptide (TPR) repeat protein